MTRPGKRNENGNATATIGFEAKLWLAADRLGNNLDTAVNTVLMQAELLGSDWAVGQPGGFARSVDGQVLIAALLAWVCFLGEFSIPSPDSSFAGNGNAISYQTQLPFIPLV